ncbi:hypothetical protein ACIODS_11940 [Micromonospora chalcea]|uniref:hypothetical protein n=1 Tax=Micromonospora chalcea TaxID=1874 RepID=UPI0038111170
MPLLREPALCWVLLVHRDCDGELVDFHWPSTDRRSLRTIEAVRWHLFAQHPDRNPPRPFLADESCLTVACGRCGCALGGGEHFADAEHGWEAAAEDGWQGDVCPACQPVGSLP